MHRPRGWREVGTSRFHDNRYIKVARLSALRTGHLHPPQKIFLVLIYVKGSVETMAIVWPEVLRQREILMTPSGFFVQFSLKICIHNWIMFASHLESKSSLGGTTTGVVHPTSAEFHVLSLDQVNSFQSFFRSVKHPSFDHQSVSCIDHWAFVFVQFWSIFAR